MIGVGEPAVEAVASATVSLAIKGSGGGNPLIDSILIDFTPVKFSPVTAELNLPWDTV